MKVNKLIETLSKVENQELDIVLYDDKLDDYIYFDADCVEISDKQVEINFTEANRQGTDKKHSGDITYVKLVENGEAVYYYTCPICSHQHKITSEHYEYKFLERKDSIQVECDECQKTLFMEV